MPIWYLDCALWIIVSIFIFIYLFYFFFFGGGGGGGGVKDSNYLAALFNYNPTEI